MNNKQAGIYAITNYFGYLTAQVKGESYSLALDGNVPALTFQEMPTKYRHFTSIPKKLYPKLNEVQIYLKYSYQQPDYSKIFNIDFNKMNETEMNHFFHKNFNKFTAIPIFEVSFKNNMPHFSHYEIYNSANKAWTKVLGHKYEWDATRKVNQLRV